MRDKIRIKVFKIIQIILLRLSFLFCSFFFKKKKVKKTWVMGVSEVANNIYLLSKTLQDVKSVCLNTNKYYTDNNYDYTVNLRFFNSPGVRRKYRNIYGPVLLGYLASKYDCFWYIYSTGFLIDRETEFKFLKSRKKKIVCMFVGSEIRSSKLMNEFCDKQNLDMFTKYLKDNDFDKKKLAKVTDKYADLVLNYEYDQISYLTKKQYAWPYMYDKEFVKNDNIFSKIDKVKIVHAPTSTVIKGTPLVRAAIKKLLLEGYNIEYVEIQNMPNNVVLENLKTAHIVLNEFYAFVPGLLGIEAMANHCAVLMSADPSIETGLPRDSEGAWMITKYWQVYDNLKYLLNNPEKIKYYADKGYDFVYKNYTIEAASKRFNDILEESGIIQLK